MSWLRWHLGTAEDGKFRVTARYADVTVVTVIGVWACLLEDAAHPDHRGIATRGNVFYGAILGLSDKELHTIIEGMEAAGLITTDHEEITITKWKERQFESDVSDPTAPERMRKYRARKDGSAPVTPPLRSVTPPLRLVTVALRPDTDTDTDKKDIRAVAKSDTPPSMFEEFWRVYPKRDGASPKAPAKVSFLASVKGGVEPLTICAAAGRYAAECRRLGSEGTPMVAQAVTWLRQKRWGDYPEVVPVDTPMWAPPPGMKSLKEEWANDSTTNIRVDAGPRQNGSNRVEQLQLPGGGSLRVEVRPEGKSPGDPPW